MSQYVEEQAAYHLALLLDAGTRYPELYADISRFAASRLRQWSMPSQVAANVEPDPS